MMAPQFRRPLQTVLDDTQGRLPGEKVVFEKASESLALPSNVVGTVSLHVHPGKRLVYDSSQLGPDIGALSAEERFIWVEARSVYSKGKEKIFRPVIQAELFTIHYVGL